MEWLVRAWNHQSLVCLAVGVDPFLHVYMMCVWHRVSLRLVRLQCHTRRTRSPLHAAPLPLSLCFLCRVCLFRIQGTCFAVPSDGDAGWSRVAAGHGRA
jgi:hypothetical protein